WSKELIIQGSQERVAPVLMTAVTAGLGLIPLVLSKGEPGKEILYPVAVVILSGLITSTLLDFFVTPAVFHRFGRHAAERLAREHAEKHGQSTGDDAVSHHHGRRSSHARAALAASAAPTPSGTSAATPSPTITPLSAPDVPGDGKNAEETP
ncbi:MAG: efflux RND transporter permease subunit, partial [Phycisphaerales bacterium]|nr:efflux RND transporter permease subunit [Phycisphaerales bacterium]